jgi:hypothetical protein
LGISASNVFATDSDGQFAYQIILARMADELKSPKHSRETMMEFKQDWVLLDDIRARGIAVAAARSAQPELPMAAAVQPLTHDGGNLLP